MGTFEPDKNIFSDPEEPYIHLVSVLIYYLRRYKCTYFKFSPLSLLFTIVKCDVYIRPYNIPLIETIY